MRVADGDRDSGFFFLVLMCCVISDELHVVEIVVAPVVSDLGHYGGNLRCSELGWGFVGELDGDSRSYRQIDLGPLLVSRQRLQRTTVKGFRSWCGYVANRGAGVGRILGSSSVR